MSTNINDGGPAFPFYFKDVACPEKPEDFWESTEYDSSHCCGMSRRDYFAGLAMQGMVAGRKCELADVNVADLARSAVYVADALIAALERGAE